MPSLSEASQHRYERLLAQRPPELYIVLDQLGIHPSELAIPSVPLHNIPLTSVQDIFAPFNYPSLAQLNSPQDPQPDTQQNQQLESPQLSKQLLQSIFDIAQLELNENPKPKPTQKPTQKEVPHSQSEPFQANQPTTNLLHRPAQSSQQPSIARPAAPPQHHEPAQPSISTGPFRTARSRLPAKRSLRPAHVRPARTHSSPDVDGGRSAAMAATRAVLGTKRPRFSPPKSLSAEPEPSADLPEVPNVDPKLVEMIMNEMLDSSPGVGWSDIAGLHFAKRCVMEAVVWPMQRPDIFKGLRGPPKGLLLFGPPGTGKTMIGRAIASQSGAKFFNISASSLMSKWVGEGEKMVRALFGVARALQPSVVFIDEIDSLLTQRTDGEQESSRRVKTEFLVQMDGAATSRDDRVLVVGATNRPQELDEAARRRLVKRLYIPLPDFEARAALVKKLLQKEGNELTEEDVSKVAEASKGYSGSDMYALCAEAALGPVRELGEAVANIEVNMVRPVTVNDFRSAARMVRASVSERDLEGYVEWNSQFGSFAAAESVDEAPDGTVAKD